MDRWGPPWLKPFNIIKAKVGSNLNGIEPCKRLRASFNKHRLGSPNPTSTDLNAKLIFFKKLANGLRLASINAVEVHSRQTSTDLNATQKHANGLRLPSINISTVCPNQASTNLCAPNSHTQDGGARYNDSKCVVNVGRVANGEWLTVELTPDLETNWPVVFQLQV